MEADHKQLPFNALLHVGDIAYASVAMTAEEIPRDDKGDGEVVHAYVCVCVCVCVCGNVNLSKHAKSPGDQCPRSSCCVSRGRPHAPQELVWDLWEEQVEPLAGACLP